MAYCKNICIQVHPTQCRSFMNAEPADVSTEIEQRLDMAEIEKNTGVKVRFLTHLP